METKMPWCNSLSSCIVRLLSLELAYGLAKTLFRHCRDTVDRVEFEMEGGIEKLVRIAKAFACERGECDLQRLVAYLAWE